MSGCLFEVRQAIPKTDVMIVKITGSLDINNIEEFEEVFLGLFKDEKFKIVLDMGKLNYISSAGIGVLFSVIKIVRQKKGDIRIASAQSQVHKTLRISEISSIFLVFETVQEAVNGF